MRLLSIMSTVRFLIRIVGVWCGYFSGKSIKSFSLKKFLSSDS
jgi:hypothetical protein